MHSTHLLVEIYNRYSSLEGPLVTPSLFLYWLVFYILSVIRLISKRRHGVGIPWTTMTEESSLLDERYLLVNNLL